MGEESRLLRFLYRIDDVLLALEDRLPYILWWPVVFLVLTLVCLPCSLFLSNDDRNAYLGRYE